MRLQALPNAESQQGTNLFIFPQQWTWSKAGQQHELTILHLFKVCRKIPHHITESLKNIQDFRWSVSYFALLSKG